MVSAKPKRALCAQSLSFKSTVTKLRHPVNSQNYAFFKKILRKCDGGKYVSNHLSGDLDAAKKPNRLYLVLKNLVLPRQGGIFNGPCLPRIAGVRVLRLCLKNRCKSLK